MKAAVGVGLGRALFRAANIRRLHIVGCSRSGTTMLHMAMTAFHAMHFYYEESALRFPMLRDRFEALSAYRHADVGWREPKIYVTKRAHRWYEPKGIDHLVRHVHAENMGVIMMIRDPRDVMLSSHSGRGGIENYVTPRHWRDSIVGGERLQSRLAKNRALMVLRYEDMVTDPEGTGRRFADQFGLKLRQGSPGFAAMKANVATTHKAFDEYLQEAVGEIRDLDPASVGKWRRRPHSDPAAALKNDNSIAPIYARFVKEHRYED
ncbi:MAG: sulfotransferase [Pacificimonas sp.]